MRTTEHAPRDPRRLLERRHCLAEIVERGASVVVERLRVKRPRSDASASQDDVAEAIEIMEDVQRRARRVFGDGHPNWVDLPRDLMAARDKLASFEDT